jgi:SAM-dependent methyltransferase
MRVLDLGCGRAMSSVFLRRELGVEVWAVDLWISPSENLRRISDAGVEDGVFPLRANARALPFAAEVFDAVVAIDSFVYFGTDDLYLAELARFVKPEGVVAIAGAGLVRELDGPVPEHLRDWWEPSEHCSLHSAEWWRRHWERTGIVSVEHADTMADGWQLWLAWQREVAPGNTVEIAAVEADAGDLLGYVRVVGRRGPGVRLDEPLTAIPERYQRHPLLRAGL